MYEPLKIGVRCFDVPRSKGNPMEISRAFCPDVRGMQRPWSVGRESRSGPTFSYTAHWYQSDSLLVVLPRNRVRAG